MPAAPHLKEIVTRFRHNSHMKSGDFSVGAEAQPYGYVYEIINSVNGKTYVGSRKLALDRRWRQYMGSGKLIKQAIAKYGIEHFRKRLIGYAPTPEELVELEGDWIIRQQALGLAQYNLFVSGHAGGDTFSKLNAKTLEEVRRRQSEGVKRHFQTANAWNKGKTAITDPRIRAQVERALARGTYRGLNLGSVRSADAKAKMSAVQKGNTNSHSNLKEENRVRIGLTNKRKLTSAGITKIQLHDQMVKAILNFDEAIGTLKSYGRSMGFSYTTFREFSYGHGPTSRGAECLLCIARERYQHLLKSDEMIASS